MNDQKKDGDVMTRVFELAKELNVSSKDLLTVLRRWDIEAKNHMSNLESEQVEEVRRRYLGDKAPGAVKRVENKENNQPVKYEAKQQMKGSVAPPIRREQSVVKHGNSIPVAQKTSASSGMLRRISKPAPKQMQESSTPQHKQRQQPPHQQQRRQPPLYQQQQQRRQQQQRQHQQPQHQRRQHSIQQQPQQQFRSAKNLKQTFATAALPKKQAEQTKKAGTLMLPESIQVKTFANLMGMTAGEIIKKLMILGMMVTINQEIDRETAEIVAHEFGWKVEALPSEADQLMVEEIEDEPDELEIRSPVVTVMGHVDHGKTSLLDAIRSTNVASQESGGITQHIGAYQIEFKNKPITFLDTPGHEAFTAMRARGARVTDIAVLVVAADDGVMPQTVEAINHAKAAGIPIIVAINKIDKSDANPDRVKQQLTEYNLVSEEWGGETIIVPVSAKQKIGLEDLLETILLVADVQELKANPNRNAKGPIIEAKLDKGLGPVATVLVQNGTLNLGDTVIAGASYGKIRAMINDKGKRVKKAGPSVPVEVLGFNELPNAGDILYVVEERVARDLAAKRQNKRWEDELRKTQKVTLNDLYEKIKEGTIKELNLIVKGDVQGSVEAIRQALERLGKEDIKVNVLHCAVGAITESDVLLASTSNAIIIGFNVRPEPMAKKIADKESVDIRLYRVIYDITSDIETAMAGMLEPEIKENVLGHAEVRAIFKVPKIGSIAGCLVVDGKILRTSEVRVLRDNVVVHEGKIGSLKRFKDDVREVASGYECGIGLEKFNDVKEGDVIESYIMEAVKATS
ncbi:MAG: translation initiation factor IF-2 [Bacillota bacterium]